MDPSKNAENKHRSKDASPWPGEPPSCTWIPTWGTGAVTKPEALNIYTKGLAHPKRPLKAVLQFPIYIVCGKRRIVRAEGGDVETDSKSSNRWNVCTGKKSFNLEENEILLTTSLRVET